MGAGMAFSKPYFGVAASTTRSRAQPPRAIRRALRVTRTNSVKVPPRPDVRRLARVDRAGSGPSRSAGRAPGSARSSRPRTRSRTRRCRAARASASGRSAGSPTGCPAPSGPAPRPGPGRRSCSTAAAPAASPEVALADDQLRPPRLEAIRGTPGSRPDRAARRHRASRPPALRHRARARNPARSAAPLPAFGTCRMTVAPAAFARAAVSSVEPSSTTTTGRCRRAASTTAPIRGPSS